MIKLEDLIHELESKIDKYNVVNLDVSPAAVGWHIEHTLLTINMIINALQHPRIEYKWSFNFNRILVLDILNSIPRGRARAPKIVQPQNAATKESIHKQLEISKENIKILDSLDKNLFFEHPYFGHLKINQTNKFLKIHTKHHLSIINDIINK
jgi:hypothetical protein